MKRLKAKETYPNFNKSFAIHTDASKVQLGGCMSKEGRPVAFYSRNLNPAQTRYTTTERELLSMVETLKEIRNILLGQQIIVHPDHANLTYKHFNAGQVTRWRLYIEKHSLDLQEIQGATMLWLMRISLYFKPPHPMRIPKNHSILLLSVTNTKTRMQISMTFTVPYDHLELAQKRDPCLKKELLNNTRMYKLKVFHGGGNFKSLICYRNKLVVSNIYNKMELINITLLRVLPMNK
jgi:RNase H-like domain found in reverse transcriptase